MRLTIKNVNQYKVVEKRGAPSQEVYFFSINLLILVLIHIKNKKNASK